MEWAVVVAELVELLLPILEVHRSNPVIGKLLYGKFVYCQLYWKDENKEKEAGNGPLFKKMKLSNEIRQTKIDAK